MKYPDFMIDCETLGVTLSKKPVILSIGVVAFDAFDKSKPFEKLQVEFSTREHRQAQVLDGRNTEKSTVDWWKEDKQKEARKIVFGKSTHRTYVDALVEVNQFIKDNCSDSKMRIWSNGANFDGPMIREFIVDSEIKCCWQFWNECCYRTLRTLRPVPKPEFEGEKHVASNDAVFQAKHLQSIICSLGLL